VGFAERNKKGETMKLKSLSFIKPLQGRYAALRILILLFPALLFR
jgi:hypothetical protein